MVFGGFQKTDLVNYPGKLAATVFTTGCNFRCPWCHNGALVLNQADRFEEEEILSFLEKRKRMLDGFVISGGEPTLHRELPLFIEKVKELGYPVKLDTNGTNPEMLVSLIDSHLVDYVAMDIKSTLENYSKVALSEPHGVKESIAILMENRVPYEFRTTCVKDLISEKDILDIAEMIKGASAYSLQRFNPEHVLDPECETFSSYSKEELETIAKKIEGCVKTIRVK